MRSRGLDRSDLIAALAAAAALGIPMLVLQRYIAETRGSAIALVAIWLALVRIAVLVAIRRRSELRLALAGTWLAVLAGTVAIGYWTGFRDVEVMEDVAVASAQASGNERDRGRSGEGATGRGERPSRTGSMPVELASGAFAGADGDAGTGTATVVEQFGGRRLLTFTDFDGDPGVEVEVYLTPGTDSVDDRVELGGLKGNVGDQQYEIPADADLRRYDTGDPLVHPVHGPDRGRAARRLSRNGAWIVAARLVSPSVSNRGESGRVASLLMQAIRLSRLQLFGVRFPP